MVRVGPEATWEEFRRLGLSERQQASFIERQSQVDWGILALGSMSVLSLPSQPDEVAVALSNALAAIHAFRPLFNAGEVVMALGFGLVHGFAFSASLSGAGLTPWQHSQALLAFNLGIEAMQLVVVLAVMPPLLMLSRSSPAFYASLRRFASVVAVALAALWVLDRAGVASFDATPWSDHQGLVVALLPALLWLAALALYGRQWLSHAQSPRRTDV